MLRIVTCNDYRTVGTMSTSAVASTRNQPTNKSWELSLYELHRQPQPAITDDTGWYYSCFILFWLFIAVITLY